MHDPTIEDLSARTYRCLREIGFRVSATPYEVAVALPDIRTRADARSPTHLRSFGITSLREIERWITTQPLFAGDDFEGLGVS